MPGEFPYDGFLSHGAKEKPVVRDVAERHGGSGFGKREAPEVWVTFVPDRQEASGR